ncbi:MAG: phosphotransferase [Candidatus Nanoarchaeia archaeon]|jgi:thiamine kinase-like enzyme
MDVSSIKKKIEKLDPKILGLNKIKINSFKKLGMGYSNLNYLADISGKLFNCRINLDQGSSSNLKNEFNNLKLIEKLGISAKPYYLSKNFMLIEYIKGKNFPRNSTKYLSKDVKNFARTVSILHNSNIKKEVANERWINHFKSRINYYLKSMDNLNKETLKKMLKIIEAKVELIKKHPYCLIHFDLSRENIVNTGKEIKLIDLEDLCYSDAGVDLGQLINCFFFKEKDIKVFMQEYKTSDKDLFRRVKIYGEILAFHDFVWSLDAIASIKNGKMSEEKLRYHPLKDRIYVARKKFNQLKKMKVISNNLKFDF